MPFTEEYRFGWPDSPLVHYRREQSIERGPDGGFTVKKSSGTNVGWLSWSSLMLAVSLGLFWVARVLRSKPVTPDPTGTASHP
jgi:hypothetical protein